MAQYHDRHTMERMREHLVVPSPTPRLPSGMPWRPCGYGSGTPSVGSLIVPYFALGR